MTCTTDTAFCYHCGAMHPKSEMRLLATPVGRRWRCTRSIAGAKKPVAERERFGQAVSARNKAQAEWRNRQFEPGRPRPAHTPDFPVSESASGGFHAN